MAGVRVPPSCIWPMPVGYSHTHHRLDFDLGLDLGLCPCYVERLVVPLGVSRGGVQIWMKCLATDPGLHLSRSVLAAVVIVVLAARQARLDSDWYCRRPRRYHFHYRWHCHCHCCWFYRFCRLRRGAAWTLSPGRERCRSSTAVTQMLCAKQMRMAAEVERGCCGTEHKSRSVLALVMVPADVATGEQRGLTVPTRQAVVDKKAWA